MEIRKQSISILLALVLLGLPACSGNILDNPAATIVPGQPPKEPILRIESGMHTAPIMSLVVDSTNEYVVTGSIDKTIRVWRASNGQLQRTIRPPISVGREGIINSIVLSPDGRTIAASGWTCEQWDNSFCIYLFERETGRLLRRITNLPNAVFYLAYSPDGNMLVATMGEQSGIRVYRADDLSLLAEDHNYHSFSKGAAFDNKGRLATTSWDGFVRLYDPRFKLIAKVKMSEGNQPYGINFSPDGAKIAVGFEDSPKVVVLSGKNLSILYTPDTSGMTWGLRSVTWSMDGDRLYAGGTSESSREPYAKHIRRWLNGGKGSYEDSPVATDTITSIKPLLDGGVIYGAADSSIGVIDAKGSHRVLVGSLNTDYRDNWSELLLSDDASIVQFSYKPFNPTLARFTIRSRVLEHNPSPDRQLAPPLTSTSQTKVLDWENSFAPILNGHRVQLEPYEMSRSVALSPDSARVVFGTEWKVRLYDRKGQLVWNIPAPGSAWAVNIVKNNRLVVVALADGTIRWYRLRDGQELLALFPHFDKRRWVLWTSSGYFDASPGAEELLGWQRNNGSNSEADFFPVGKFRAAYYRPDVIEKILDTLDEGEAIRLANLEAGRSLPEKALEKQLPPVVSILSPASNTEVSMPEVLIRVDVRSPSGEAVTDFRALADGRPVPILGGKALESNPEHGDGGGIAREIRILIPERDVEIAIIAENRFSASAPATIRLRWQGISQKADFTIKPKLYMLAVGVSRYENKDIRLEYANKDAMDFAAAMRQQQGGLYREVHIKTLIDQGATRDEIMDGLEWIRKETTSKDVAIIYFAGHGVNDQNGTYYFLPVNADPEKLMRTGVIFFDIKNTLGYLAGKSILFIDTCHSGNIMGGGRRGIADITGLVNELTTAENGVVVFAASTGNQYSLEDQAWGNGAFTKALVEGVKGKADYLGHGKISINMLDLYISERVKELTKGRQTPTTTKPQTIPDFPIAVSQ